MKKLIAMLLALVMVFSLVACGAKEEAPTEAPAEKPAEAPAETPAEEPVEEPAEEAEEVTLYLYIQNVQQQDVWLGLIDEFEALHPNVTVEMMDSQENYFTTILATGDVPDVFNPAMASYSKQMIDDGLITDISGTEAYKHISSTYQDLMTYNGVCLGIPQGAAFSCMFYDMTILAEAGWEKTPENIDELFQCLEDVKAAGYDALTLSGNNGTVCYMPWECILANTVAKEMGSAAAYDAAFKDGTLNMQNEKAIEILDKLSGYVMPGSATCADDDVVAAMATGTVGMCFAGNWSAAKIVGAIESAGHVAGASLPPLNAPGEQVWISVSPESTLAMGAADNGEAHAEARLAFYEFLWESGPATIRQNAYSTIPVIDTVKEEDIVLVDCVVPLVGQVAATQGVLMSFNSWHSEYDDVALVALRDAYAGNATASECAQALQDQLAVAYLNMG